MNITFTSCTLGGWLSGHGASHTFNNCVFTKSGDYANYIPYCYAAFNACTFSEGFTISLKHGSRYIFDTSCKYKEDVVTEPGNLQWDFSGDGNDNNDEIQVEIGDNVYNYTNDGNDIDWIFQGDEGFIPV